MSEKETDYLIEVKNLKEYFYPRTKFLNNIPLKAVDGVSFKIEKGKTLGLVGESGCGKTTVGRTILNLYKPTSGEILYKGKLVQSKQSIHEFRNKATMVFQDSYSSLDPRMTVADLIAEPLDIQKTYKTKEEREKRVEQVMQYVGLPNEHKTRYAHEFSGGQRQRIGIARALSVEPELIICDEPVSALDVSIQAQVINTFKELQKKLGLTYLFIAHDLLVIKYICDKIAVMYLGRIIEIGDADTLYHRPIHPYTKSLISAVPIPDPNELKSRSRIILQGDIPSPMNVPSGCSFRTRCPYATNVCAEKIPSLHEIGGDRQVACHKAEDFFKNIN